MAAVYVTQYLLRHSHTGHMILLWHCYLKTSSNLENPTKGGSYQGRLVQYIYIYNREISAYLLKPVYIQLYISGIHGGYLWQKSS